MEKEKDYFPHKKFQLPCYVCSDIADHWCSKCNQTVCSKHWNYDLKCCIECSKKV